MLVSKISIVLSSFRPHLITTKLVEYEIKNTTSYNKSKEEHYHMINRAKCKLCNSTIESFHRLDRVECKCGEISVGGDSSTDMACAAKDWSNFLRVDDEGNEIIPKISIYCKQEPIKDVKSDIISVIDDMIKDVERLPDHAKTAAITQYDYLALLFLLKRILIEDKQKCL